MKSKSQLIGIETPINFGECSVVFEYLMADGAAAQPLVDPFSWFSSTGTGAPAPNVSISLN